MFSVWNCVNWIFTLIFYYCFCLYYNIFPGQALEDIVNTVNITNIENEEREQFAGALFVGVFNGILLSVGAFLSVRLPFSSLIFLSSFLCENYCLKSFLNPVETLIFYFLSISLLNIVAVCMWQHFSSVYTLTPAVCEDRG